VDLARELIDLGQVTGGKGRAVVPIAARLRRWDKGGPGYWHRKSRKSFTPIVNQIMMLLEGIELSTSPLPRVGFPVKVAQNRHLVCG
jgi:hypothetical protein